MHDGSLRDGKLTGLGVGRGVWLRWELVEGDGDRDS